MVDAEASYASMDSFVRNGRAVAAGINGSAFGLAQKDWVGPMLPFPCDAASNHVHSIHALLSSLSWYIFFRGCFVTTPEAFPTTISAIS